jgi:large subunit ribosomal protein L7/L12
MMSTEDMQVEPTLDVVLLSVGERKIEVIKAVRAITGFHIRDAHSLVESAPTEIIEDINPDEAAEIKALFESIGAVVEIV